MRALRRFNRASALLGLLRIQRFWVELQRLERGKRMILGIGGHHRRLENGIRPAWVGIYPQKQRIGREPAEIDNTIHDRLRRVRNFDVALGGLIDEIGEFWNLLRGREDQIDRLIDVVLDRIKRNDAGLPDSRTNMAGDVKAA